MVSLIKSMMLLEKSIAWPRNRYIYYYVAWNPLRGGFFVVRSFNKWQSKPRVSQ